MVKTNAHIIVFFDGQIDHAYAAPYLEWKDTFSDITRYYYSIITYSLLFILLKI